MSVIKTEQAERIRVEAHQWRTLITSKHATEEDIKSFESWCDASVDNRQAYLRACEVYSSLGQMTMSDLRPHLLKPTLKERFVAFLGTELSHKTIFRPAWQVTAFAALVFIAISSLILFQNQTLEEPVIEIATFSKSYSTDAGIIERHDLPDGTSLTIAPKSVIEVTFFENQREVNIETGSAFFDVRTNLERPFFVNSDNLKVKVIGTSFDVQNTPKAHKVSVAKGKVNVTYPITIAGKVIRVNTRHLLTSGQSVVASTKDGLGKPLQVERESIGAWRDRRLIYTNASIEDVVHDLDRFDKRSITFGQNTTDIRKLRLSGSFSAKNPKDVDNVLIKLTELYDIELKKSDENILLEAEVK